jgi:hypothetical protein
MSDQWLTRPTLYCCGKPANYQRLIGEWAFWCPICDKHVGKVQDGPAVKGSNT